MQCLSNLRYLESEILSGPGLSHPMLRFTTLRLLPVGEVFTPPSGGAAVPVCHHGLPGCEMASIMLCKPSLGLDIPPIHFRRVPLYTCRTMLIHGVKLRQLRSGID